MTPADELAALGAFYGIAVDDVLADHAADLDRYAEWVLGRDAFALVTLAPITGDSLAARAAAHWPAAITGVKLELGTAIAPTYYVRTLCPWAEGVAWLSAQGIPAAAQVPPARTLYGLGFQGAVVKTYALAPGGFVSYRVDTALHREHKDYVADVEWDAIVWPDARWAAIGELGRTLGFRSAGHVAPSAGGLKIYVERAGAIATDRSFG